MCDQYHAIHRLCHNGHIYYNYCQNRYEVAEITMVLCHCSMPFKGTDELIDANQFRPH